MSLVTVSLKQDLNHRSEHHSGTLLHLQYVKSTSLPVVTTEAINRLLRYHSGYIEPVGSKSFNP